MKKHISILLAVCMLVSVIASLLMLTPAADAIPTAKLVYLNSNGTNVAIPSYCQDLSVLCDSKKLISTLENQTYFKTHGIVLVENTERATAGVADYCQMVIDLGESTLIDTVNVAFYVNFTDRIWLPNDGEVIISFSDDGKTFKDQKSFYIEDYDDETALKVGVRDYYFELDAPVSHRYVMVSLEYGDANPDWKWDPSVMLEWFGFTELSAGLKMDYENADPEIENSEEVEEFIKAAPDYESYGYTLKESDSFFVTHFNDALVEGASCIMTKEYTGAGWWTHIAFAPVEGQEGMYTVTEVSTSGLADGLATPLAIPEGGFVWITNYGNDYSAQGGIKYTNDAVNAAIEIAKSMTVGRVVCFENVDFEGEDVHNINGKLTYYTEGYVYNSMIYLMKTDDEILQGDESSAETPSQEPSNEPDESSAPDEPSEPDESSAEQSSTLSSESSQAPTDGNGSFPWWIIIVVVAVVVIAAVVFIIIKKKK